MFELLAVWVGVFTTEQSFILDLNVSLKPSNDRNLTFTYRIVAISIFGDDGREL